MADGLSRSLQTLMLSGNAEYAIDWLRRTSESPELLTIQVIRKDMKEAFLDGQTLNEVNHYLGNELFSRPLSPARHVPDISHDAFTSVINGHTFHELNESAGRLTFLLPIQSGDECMSCHGYDDSNIRGVLRISTSVSHAQQRIDHALQDTIFYGFTVAFIIGLLLFLFIRKQILSPIELITDATSAISAGDMETRIDISSHTEIGRLGESFNTMTDALKSSTVSKSYFETIMSSMGEMLFVTDLDHRIQFSNSTVQTTLGYSLDELIDKPLDELIKGGSELTEEEKMNLSEMGELKSIERELFHKSGDKVPVLITVTLMRHGDEKEAYQVIHAGRDITRQKRTERDLRLAAKVMESDSNAILICDDQATIVLVNPAFCDITGYSREEVIGKNPRILSSGRQPPEFYKKMWDELHSNGMWSGEIWNRRKNGEIYPESLSITVVRNVDGEITNYVSIFTDISEQKIIEQKLSHMAHHDQLTGLPNRTLFTDRLEHALAHATRAQYKVGLLFIDIDGFKPINDDYGHDVGDALLCEIANTFSALIRDADTVARVGGDEFVIILENLYKQEAAIQVAEKVLSAFDQPIIAADTACHVGCSIGIAIALDDTRDADELVKKADTAMYLAKSSGKQQYRLYNRDCVQPEKREH